MTPLLIHAAMAEKNWMPDVDYHAVNEKLKELCELIRIYGNKNGIK